MKENNTLFENLMCDWLSGTISDADKARLFELIEGSEELEKEYRERVRLYALLHVPSLAKEREEKVKMFEERLMRGKSGRRAIDWRLYMRNAAAVALLVVLSSLGSILIFRDRMISSGSEQYYETVVPLGSQTKLTLPDGSVAMLNSGSSLKYNLSFGKKERNVILQGEAYFEVAKDLSKPFQVEMKDLTVQVTGTKFNARYYQEDQSIEVSLIEGAVNVVVPDKMLRLQPDEKATYNTSSGELAKTSVEAYKSAIWSTGRLSFVNASVADILKEVERSYNVTIHVETTRIEGESFSGTIDLTMTLENVFNFMDVDNKFDFERTGNTVTMRDR